MGAETWSLMAKLCDSCKRASATIFCHADTSFLCVTCDSKIHVANKLASRQARVLVSARSASFTYKDAAATLYVTCDREFHSVNPLARLPVVPFYDSAADAKSHGSAI